MREDEEGEEGKGRGSGAIFLLHKKKKDAREEISGGMIIPLSCCKCVSAPRLRNTRRELIFFCAGAERSIIKKKTKTNNNLIGRTNLLPAECRSEDLRPRPLRPLDIVIAAAGNQLSRRDPVQQWMTYGNDVSR